MSRMTEWDVHLTHSNKDGVHRVLAAHPCSAVKKVAGLCSWSHYEECGPEGRHDVSGDPAWEVTNVATGKKHFVIWVEHG